MTHRELCWVLSALVLAFALPVIAWIWTLPMLEVADPGAWVALIVWGECGLGVLALIVHTWRRPRSPLDDQLAAIDDELRRQEHDERRARAALRPRTNDVVRVSGPRPRVVGEVAAHVVDLADFQRAPDWRFPARRGRGPGDAA